MSRRSMMKRTRKLLIEAEEKRREPQLIEGSGSLTMCFTQMLDEYLHYKPHPRVVELERKYWQLLRNDSVRYRLYEKYPSIRMSDEEYREMWDKALKADSFLSKVPKTESWCGGEIAIPFRRADKD